MTRAAPSAATIRLASSLAGPHTAFPDATPASARTPAATEGARKVIQLATLLGSAQSVDIVHGEQTYRLQITKAGKLILTK